MRQCEAACVWKIPVEPERRCSRQSVDEHGGYYFCRQHMKIAIFRYRLSQPSTWLLCEEASRRYFA